VRGAEAIRDGVIQSAAQISAGLAAPLR
jgi:hypothetical protein